MPWLATFATVRPHSVIPAQLRGRPINIRFCRDSARNLPPGALPTAHVVYHRTRRYTPLARSVQFFSGPILLVDGYSNPRTGG